MWIFHKHCTDGAHRTQYGFDGNRHHLTPSLKTSENNFPTKHILKGKAVPRVNIS